MNKIIDRVLWMGAGLGTGIIYTKYSKDIKNAFNNGQRKAKDMVNDIKTK
ncbi:MAG: hypothetical protein RSB41_02425 [Bacilli bacterium]